MVKEQKKAIVPKLNGATEEWIRNRTMGSAKLQKDESLLQNQLFIYREGCYSNIEEWRRMNDRNKNGVSQALERCESTSYELLVYRDEMLKEVDNTSSKWIKEKETDIGSDCDALTNRK